MRTPLPAALVALALASGCGSDSPCEVYTEAAQTCLETWGIDAEPACDPASRVSEDYLLCAAAAYEEADCTEFDTFVGIHAALEDCALVLAEEL